MTVSLMRRIGLFLTGNIAAQGLGAVAGLLLARWMAVGDYGAYTIVITLMGAMTVLTKGGTHLGYTAILGRTWPDMTRAAEAVTAALQMRRRISVVIVPLVLGAAWMLLRRNGVGLNETLILLLLLALFWWADMQTRLVDQILSFAKQTTRVQMLDAGLAALRLVAVAALHLGGLLSLPAAVALGTLVALLRVRPILGWIRRLLPPGPAPAARPDDTAEIRATVRRQMPVEIYYVFQAQIALVVLTLFGSVTEIAGFGALTRINQLLLPVEALTYAFLLPMFTRCSVAKARRIYLPLVALTMLPGAALVLIALLVPGVLLWLVGPNYAHLHQDIAVAAIVAMLGRGAHTAWNLLAHRGWVRFSWVQIPVGLGASLLAPFVLDLGTITGALLLQLSVAAGWIAAAALDFRRSRHEPEIPKGADR